MELLKFFGTAMKYVLKYMLLIVLFGGIICVPAISFFCYMLRIMDNSFLELVFSVLYFYFVGFVLFKTGKYVLKKFWVKPDKQ